MKPNQRKYLDLVKKDMINTLESGVLKEPTDQYNYVNTILQRILLLNDDKLSKTIMDYFDEQDKLEQRIQDAQANLSKIMDEYADNCKNIYEGFKKL